MTANLCDGGHDGDLVLATARVEIECAGGVFEDADYCDQCREDLAVSADLKRDGIVAVEVISVYRALAVA